MHIPFVDLKKQYQDIRTELQEAINGVLEKGIFVGGDEVEWFEEEFAQYCDVRFAVGVGSGTEALHLALHWRWILCIVKGFALGKTLVCYRWMVIGNA